MHLSTSPQGGLAEDLAASGAAVLGQAHICGPLTEEGPKLRVSGTGGGLKDAFNDMVKMNIKEHKGVPSWEATTKMKGWIAQRGKQLHNTRMRRKNKIMKKLPKSQQPWP